MKICPSNKKWLGPDLTMDMALDRVLEPNYRDSGKLERVEADIERLKWILRVILTPKQILRLIKDGGYPDAILCDRDGAK